MSHYLDLSPRDAALKLRSIFRPQVFLIFGGHIFGPNKLQWTDQVIEHTKELWSDSEDVPIGRRINGVCQDVYDVTIQNALGAGKYDMYFFHQTNLPGAAGAIRRVKAFADILHGDFNEVTNFLGPTERPLVGIPELPAPPHDPKLPSVILVDLDGTLANSSHRKPFGVTEAEILADKVVPHILEIIHHYDFERVLPIFLTGRGYGPGELAATEKWLNTHVSLISDRDAEMFHKIGIHLAEPVLIGRPLGDNRPDWEFKLEAYEKHIRGRYNVRLVLDDRPSVIRMWARLGLPVLRCRPEVTEF